MNTPEKIQRREVATPKGIPLTRPGPVGGVRDINRMKKQQAIRDAALTLFLEHGVEGVSVDDIMSTAHMAKGSFYRYFADQTALVDDLISSARNHLLGGLDACSKDVELATSRESEIAAYKHIGTALSVMLLECPGQIRLYLQESRAPAVGARRPLVALSHSIRDHAIDLAQKARQHGILKPISVAFSALTIIGATERLLLALLQSEDIGDVTKLPEMVAMLILDGLKG
jgi:AcrR family transcriptional regulator